MAEAIGPHGTVRPSAETRCTFEVEADCPVHGDPYRRPQRNCASCGGVPCKFWHPPLAK